MLNTIQTYRQVTKDISKTLQTTASQAVVKRESKYYLDNISKVKSIDDFMNNQRLFSFAMKAFGLEDMTYAKAFVKKALTEGVESDQAFANRLVDTRLKEFVTAFNFQRRGEFTTGFPETKQGTVDRYVRQTLEQDVGQQNEGVRLALYFERKISSITSPLSLLADKALLKVTQTALDIPASSSTQSLEKQVATIKAKLDVADLKDPKKLKAFLEKFVTKWEIANPTSQSSIANTIALGNSSSATVSSSVLQAIQNLKLGGI